jgi:hypothetical protein
MTEEEAQKLGDDFRDAIFKRTGLKGSALVCPREKSDMTPCTARDGGVTVIFIRDRPCCVGCETSIEVQMEKELARCR